MFLRNSYMCTTLVVAGFDIILQFDFILFFSKAAEDDCG